MGPSKTPTKAECEWMARIADHGCVACLQDGIESSASVHHIVQGNRRQPWGVRFDRKVRQRGNFGERAMTDRKLLEAAAKAAGVNAEWYAGLGMCTPGDSIPRQWNPLTDDGDALRLAVKLLIDIGFNDSALCVYADECMEPYARNADENAATRRAIVRAAAEMANK